MTTFEVVRETHGVGCPHAAAPNGCSMKRLRCTVCGEEVTHQCGNNALLGWHQCQEPEPRRVEA